MIRKLTFPQLMLLGVAFLFLGLPILGMISQKMSAGDRLAIVPEAGNGADMAVYQTSDASERTKAMGGAATSLMIAPDVRPGPPFIPGGEGFTPGVERTIVKTASLTLLVEETRQAVSEVTAVINQTGGLVTSSNISEDESEAGVIRANLTARIPVAKLDAAMADIKALAAKVESENTNADDQTEYKVDLEAQLRNAQATEAQLLNIMRQATTVEDTLKVQQQLGEVRSQIERLQAQVDNISGAAAMATLHISLTTKESELPIVNPGPRTLQEEIIIALRDTVTLYRELFVAGLRLVIVGLPALILLAVIHWLFKKMRPAAQ